MNDLSVRSTAKLAILFALPVMASAQASKPAENLTIAGQPEQAQVLRINGKAYVDLESLARITHGTLSFQGSQTILTLPQAGSNATASTDQANKPPHLSEAFLAAEIEALTQIREWHVSLVNAIQDHFPVSETWVGRLRRSAESKLQLAVAAATTEPDHRTLDLLNNEFSNMQQESDQLLAMHDKVTYIASEIFENNTLDEKILTCQHALAGMAASKQFQDEPSCH